MTRNAHELNTSPSKVLYAYTDPAGRGLDMRNAASAFLKSDPSEITAPEKMRSIVSAMNRSAKPL